MSFPHRCAVLLLALVAASGVRAQQDFHTTQFLFNKLALNPAYAGGDRVTNLVGVYRHQWAGLDGAPRTAAFSAHGPLSSGRMGIGLQAYDDRWGVNHHLGLFGSYNYKLPLGRSTLAIGLQAGVVNLRSALDETNPLDPTDPVFQQGVSGWYPNAGVGVYWSMPGRAFAGIGVPRLIQHAYGDLVPGADVQARLYRHTYLMGGYVFALGRGLLLRPTALVKWAGPAETGAPLDVEANLSALLADRIWLGAGWRAGDAVSLMTEIFLTDQILLGYAYDLGTSALSAQHGGSHEVMLRYQFTYRRDGVVHPRTMPYF